VDLLTSHVDLFLHVQVHTCIFLMRPSNYDAGDISGSIHSAPEMTCHILCSSAIVIDTMEYYHRSKQATLVMDRVISYRLVLKACLEIRIIIDAAVV